ncbi:hypothetical protein L1887_51929 [Cichorium endivia]|nr:hypothetical protein L1887_51929 [Cichorium endivia]
MAGVKDRIFEACEDWREALGAWGTLVHPTLKRDDVPTTAAIILDKFPVDATLASEAVQQHLIRGEVRQAVQRSQEVDVWLGAHLGDLADKVGLLEDEVSLQSDLRQQLVLQYAQHLLDEQGLWRISIDYLAACGAKGRNKMSHVILSVPLDGPEQQGQEEDNAMDDGDDEEVAAPPAPLARAEQVLRACSEHGLEAEARVICRRMSRSCMDKGEYGVAIAYCVRASDTVLIRTIADRILVEYVTRGAEAFDEIVDSVPTSLLAPPDDEREFGRPTLFSKRLAFLARFRDFHRLYADGQWTAAASLLVELVTTEAAPERFLAVLLVDAIPLLEDGQATWFDRAQTFEMIRIVERITNAVAMHPGHGPPLPRLPGPAARRRERAEQATKRAAGFGRFQGVGQAGCGSSVACTQPGACWRDASRHCVKGQYSILLYTMFALSADCENQRLDAPCQSVAACV